MKSKQDSLKQGRNKSLTTDCVQSLIIRTTENKIIAQYKEDLLILNTMFLKYKGTEMFTNIVLNQFKVTSFYLKKTMLVKNNLSRF